MGRGAGRMEGREEVWRRGSVVVSREGDGVMGYVGMEWRVG